MALVLFLVPVALCLNWLGERTELFHVQRPITVGVIHLPRHDTRSDNFSSTRARHVKQPIVEVVEVLATEV